MVQTAESTFKVRDGTDLYTKTWKPDVATNLSLIFVHGFSDHINAYYELFPTLASAPYNITVYGFDQRGWGRSAHKKSDWGATGDTHQVLTDLHDFVCHVSGILALEDEGETTPQKLFLMGHSMGGGEVLMYLLSDPAVFGPSSKAPLPITGLLVESPFIAFPPTSRPNSFTVAAGRIAGKLFPNVQLPQKLDSSAMSRNPQVCKDWDNDSLCHDTGTLRGLAGLLDRAGYLDGLGSGATQQLAGMRVVLPCPAWFGHGNADKVCDFAASRKLFDKLLANSPGDEGKSRFVSYEGGYHKLHGEPDGMAEQFARDAGDWILQITSGKGGQGAENSPSQATAGTGKAADENVKSRL